MIGGFVLSTLIGYYLLDSLAKLLNLKSLETQVPSEFSDVYDENRYRRSQEYTRTNTWFELVVSTTTLTALLAFWFLGRLRGFGPVNPEIAPPKHSAWIALSRRSLRRPRSSHAPFHDLSHICDRAALRI